MLIELRCAQALARQAGKQLLEEIRREIDISIKATDDLVTNVDKSLEKFLRDEIHKLFPDDTIWGEEFGHESPRGEATNRRWLIDPIDGTLNFASSLPLYCISIGLQVAQKTHVGVIYDPMRDELFSARRGHGAFLNGTSIEVSNQRLLRDTMLVTGFPSKSSENFEKTLAQFAHLTRNCRTVRRLGSAAIDLAYVACGRLDGFWEYGLSPWDTAAGYLLVEEAGGRVTTIEGGLYNSEIPNILASNAHIHEALMQYLDID